MGQAWHRIGRCSYGLLIGLGISRPVFAATTAPTFTTPSIGGTLVKFLFVLLLIIGLAIISIRFLSKRTQVQSKGSIQLLAARQIAPNRSVQVISVGDKRFLVGVGEQITLLADVTDTYPSPDEAFGLPDISFQQTLAGALDAVRSKYRKEGRGDGSDV